MKRNKLAIAGLLIVVALLLAAAVLLYRGISQFRDVSGQLNASRQRLDRLYAAAPFPSEDNIEAEKLNLEKLQRELKALLTELSVRQVEPMQTAPARFVEMFRGMEQRLAARAAETGVRLPEDFAFGFQRHRAGFLPNTADVPRLIQQLEIIEQLVDVLYDARVHAITAVTRQEFETGAAPAPAFPGARPPPTAPRGGLFGDGAAGHPAHPAPARRPGDIEEAPARIGILGDDGLYASMRFSLEFRAREAALLDVLNRLAGHPMFVVVTKVNLAAEFAWQPTRAAVPDLGGVPPEASEPPPPLESMTRTERIVTGIEHPFQVTVELEVYRFRKDEAS